MKANQQKPLSSYFLAKLKKVRYARLTLYDLCVLAPFASEARVRFAIRELMRHGHALPRIRVLEPGEDYRSMFVWEITYDPYILFEAGNGRLLLSDKPVVEGACDSF